MKQNSAGRKDPPRKALHKVLFVCVGNACRSPMAEAWAKYHGRDKVEAHSAGMYPYGRIAGETYDVMTERGISLDGQCSKGLADVDAATMSVVVRMGPEVAFTPPEGFQGRILEWEIPDPFGGSAETFRSVRDSIEQRVLGLLRALE